MKYKAFTQCGAKTPPISLIGFGAMGISEFYGESDLSLATEALQSAFEQGINHFDTADGYGFGDNERFLGQALELAHPAKRKTLIIASKAGILRERNNPSVRGISIEPDYLQGKLDESLSNLQTDYLDIFYIHRLPKDASSDALQKLARFLESVLKSGRARSVGLSEPRLEQLETIHAICPVHYVQSEYSMLERIVERNGVLDFCRANNINFVAYSPLSRGLLSDTFDPAKLSEADFRATLPRFYGEHYVQNQIIINGLKAISVSLGMSLSAMAICWLIQQGALVIPGMRKPQRVLDAVSAIDVFLNDEALAQIQAILQQPIQGMRYAPAAMLAYGFE